MSDLSIFRYDGADVRTFTIEGEPWFALIDVCAILDIGNPSAAASRLDEDEVTLISNEGRQTNVVNEPGLYSLVLGSRKPEARAFKRWVTHEVLPAIRQTGSYAVPETPEQLMARALVTAQGVIERKDVAIAALTPRAEAWDELASAEGDYEVADAAKILARAGVETGRTRLFNQMNAIGWIYRSPQGKWKARQTAVDSGYLREKPQSHHHPRTGELVLDPPQVRVTLRGLERLRVRLGKLHAVEVAS